MKNVKLSAVILAAMLSLTVLAGCGEDTDTTSSDNSSNTVVSDVQNQSDDNEESSSVSDTEEPSDSEESTADTESSTESSTDVSNTSSAESSTESSDEQSSEESEDLESSSEESSEVDGYYFDDEQIVDDYHEAEVFTNNAEFNELFKNNSIDKAYTEELQGSEGTTAEMRTIIQKYAGQWKNESSSAFIKLAELLADKPEELSKLEKSQSDWENGTQQAEESFYAEAESQGEENGSMLLIGADTAIMNYYKGRTAVLYEQIYELTGSFEL